MERIRTALIPCERVNVIGRNELYFISCTRVYIDSLGGMQANHVGARLQPQSVAIYHNYIMLTVGVVGGAEMAKHFVPNTGAKIPSVGLGTWQSDPGVVGDAVYAAIKAGYRHIDCARMYKNEKEVGMALKKLFEEGVVKREDLFITSKLWCDCHAPEDVPESLDETLSDLQLEFIGHSESRRDPALVTLKITYHLTSHLPGQQWRSYMILRWNIQMGHSVLPKSVSEERIKQNIDVYDWSVPEDLLVKFSEIKQVRLLRGDIIVNPHSVYKTHEELWDGEI